MAGPKDVDSGIMLNILRLETPISSYGKNLDKENIALLPAISFTETSRSGSPVDPAQVWWVWLVMGTAKHFSRS